MSSRGGIRSDSGRELLSPRSHLVSKEKKKKTTARLPVVGSRWPAVLIIAISICSKKLLSIEIAHARYRDKGPLRGIFHAEQIKNKVSTLPPSTKYGYQ